MVMTLLKVSIGSLHAEVEVVLVQYSPHILLGIII